jgi:hypothetical protein
MGTLLKIVGAGWAVLGVANIFMSPSISGSNPNSSMGGLVLLFNFVVFVLPGLGICGLGFLVANKKKRAAGRVATAAQIGRFCGACGKPIPEGNRFCGSCGKPQQEGIVT